MKGKKVLAAVLGVAALGVCTAGLCACNLTAKITYADSDKYSVGAFVYASSDVKAVEINWVAGEVILVQSDLEILNVSENGTELSDSQKLHWFLDNGTLKIQYCALGYNRRIKSNLKKLTVELPYNIGYTVNVTSADVNAQSIDCIDFDFATTSGDLTVDTMNAQAVNLKATSGDVRLGNATVNDGFNASSVSGEISADKIAANSINASTTSGNIDIGEVDSKTTVDCKTVSGEVTIASMRASKVKVGSTSGNIALTLMPTEDLDVDTVSGNVRLRFTDTLDATVNFSTISGSFKSSLAHETNGKNHKFGNGTHAYSVSSTSGNLSVD